MMDEKTISNVCGKYRQYGLWLTVAVALAILILMSVCGLMRLACPLAVGVLFTLLVNTAYGYAWGGVAKSSPSSLTKFYLAASAIRMMAAALTVVVFCVLNRDRQAIIDFVAVFFAFYVVMLVFDGVFFARVEKNNNQKRKI